MSDSAAKKATENSHYVPVFLLNQWRAHWGSNNSEYLLRGYSWRSEAKRLIHRSLGPKAFCSTKQYYLPKTAALRPDVIEDKILTPVDDLAAPIIEKLRRSTQKVKFRGNFVKSFGFAQVSDDERIAVSKFIVSLIARNPYEIYDLVYNKIKQHEDLFLNNKEIQDVFDKNGIEGDRLDFIRKIGLPIEVLALLRTHAQIQSKNNGLPVKQKAWTILEIPECAGTLVISDCPVFLTGPVRDRNSSIILPISPRHLMLMSGTEAFYEVIAKMSPQKIVKFSNTVSARSSMRYVFAATEEHETWLGKYLKNAGGYPWDKSSAK